jgi:hypothetical protein
VWLRDDYRQSFLTLSLALKGNTMPFVVSSYQMYGVHPDKLWPAIVARRKANLGAEYSRFYDANDLPLAGIKALPLFPRKPMHSEKTEKERVA